MYLSQPVQFANYPPPNYVHPKTRGNALVIINSVLLGVAALFLGLRLYTRLFIRRWFGLDDISITLAFACTVAFNTVIYMGLTQYNWDRHIYDIPLAVIPASVKLIYFGRIFFILASMFTAYALLLFYYRLIRESQLHWFRIILHIVFAFNVGLWTALLLCEIFVCTPISFYWSFIGPKNAHCLNEGTLTMVGGGLKTFLDLVITTLPLPLISKVSMRPQQRIVVAALFTLGYVVTGAGAARVYFNYKALYTDGDVSWWGYPTFIAATIENNVAIVCACGPTIRPLFPHWFGSESRIRKWISTNAASPSPSKQAKDSNQTSGARSNPTQTRSFYLSRTTVSGDDIDDVELIIQKHSDCASNNSTRRTEDVLRSETASFEQPSSGSAFDNPPRDVQRISCYTVGSGTYYESSVDIHLDLEEQPYHSTMPTYASSSR